MSDKAGILQTVRDVCAYLISLVHAPLFLATGVIIAGTLMDLVIFPGYYYGTILILFVWGLVLAYFLGVLALHDFREWRKQQRRAGR